MKAGTEVIAGYEARCFGLHLAQQLSDVRIGCAVTAPRMLLKMPSNRMKTDRRDASALAKALRSGGVHDVPVPTEQDEAVQRLPGGVRRHDVKWAKQRMLAFLLRKGARFTESSSWTTGHWRWPRAL